MAVDFTCLFLRFFRFSKTSSRATFKKPQVLRRIISALDSLVSSTFSSCETTASRSARFFGQPREMREMERGIVVINCFYSWDQSR